MAIQWVLDLIAHGHAAIVSPTLHPLTLWTWFVSGLVWTAIWLARGGQREYFLQGLHKRGGRRLIWDAVPDAEGGLTIIDLRLLDTTGKPIPWPTRWLSTPGNRSAALKLATHDSYEPGHFVLALPERIEELRVGSLPRGHIRPPD
jgi:hypothetical protein